MNRMDSAIYVREEMGKKKKTSVVVVMAEKQIATSAVGVKEV